MERVKVIKELIDKTGLSTKAFAEKAGIPYTTLRSMMERGFSKSAVENVIRVCKTLGITIDDMEKMVAGKNPSDKEEYDIQTIAAHHDGDEWTEEELEEIERFKEFVRSKRKQQE